MFSDDIYIYIYIYIDIDIDIYILYPISYILYPISYILYPISYILYPISYILYPISISISISIYFCNSTNLDLQRSLLAKEVFCPQGSSNGAGQGESECVA